MHFQVFADLHFEHAWTSNMQRTQCPLNIGTWYSRKEAITRIPGFQERVLAWYRGSELIKL
jgi:hypothetical protein